MTPITVLFFSANPSGTEYVRVDREARAVQDACRIGLFARHWKVVPLSAVRYADLQVNLLEHQPHIVHFGGHGESGYGIVLEDELGEPFFVNKEVLMSLFIALKGNVRCVVLNACYSVEVAEAVADVIDCVIAFPAEIEDGLSISFSSGFYQAVASGCDVATAFKLGVNRMESVAGDVGHIADQLPVLLSRHVAPETVCLLSEDGFGDSPRNDLPRVRVDAVLHANLSTITPIRLFGRANLVSQIEAALQSRDRVLLTGMVGSGKTAVASSVASARIAVGKGPVLWLTCGDEPADALFDALARLGERKELLKPGSSITSFAREARTAAFRELLISSRATLIVLDDMRNGSALQEVLDAIPDTIAVLVTSYLRLPLTTSFDIPDLSPEAAAQLLCHHAGLSAHTGDGVTTLCELLGNHALAVELAGKSLRVDGRSPDELVARIQSAPYEVGLPAGFAHPQRNGIGALIASSVRELSPAGLEVLTAFGELFSTSSSSELLGAFEWNSRTWLQDGLDALVRRSLARRHSNSNHYEVHRLTYSYARTLANQKQNDPQYTVDAVLKYLNGNSQNVVLLDSDMANLIGAAQVADDERLVRLMCYLAAGGFPDERLPSYFDSRSCRPQLLDGLKRAIAAAEKMLPESAVALHYLVSKYGSTAFRSGDFQTAAAAYERAMLLSPTPVRHSLLAGNCAFALALSGQMVRSDEMFDQATAEAKHIGELRVLNTILHWRCTVAGKLKQDYGLAQDLAMESLDVANRLGDPLQIALANSNLAAVELSSGVYWSIQRHTEALKLFREIDQQPLVAQTLQALAEDYHAGCDFESALAHLRQAHTLYKELGDRAGQLYVETFIQRWGYSLNR